MTVKTAPYFLALLACAGAAEVAGDKPSPVHYRSSTTPARRSQGKSPAISAGAQEGSRNRLSDTPAAQLGAARPQTKIVDGIQSGVACFYGVKQTDAGIEGKEQEDQELRAAHAFLPFGSQVTVTNTTNGRSLKVTITDRIPSDADRVISVSRRAAERLGFVSAGTAPVKLEVLREASRL